jgi:preprotein translocase subunit SecA
MDIAASLIKLFFGSKADKDRKEVEPYLVKIKAVYPTIEALSNDELRAHSSNLKKQIANFIAADEARIVELKARLELPDTSLSDKEKISKEIDETVKRIDEKIEQKLDELLPEAFAIMKDTAPAASPRTKRSKSRPTISTGSWPPPRTSSKSRATRRSMRRTGSPAATTSAGI